MIVTWGDGSGTGLSVTFNLATPSNSSDMTTLSIWKGVWAARVSSFSSNYKEMRTLAYTLEHEKYLGGEAVKERRILYVTDNMSVIMFSDKALAKPLLYGHYFLKLNFWN